ncbi:MAG TPA: hypothetical protein VFX59_10505 [Polyangiales bacterium]|nr:hypothetical protein [Polyangiales bacterium]
MASVAHAHDVRWRAPESCDRAGLDAELARLHVAEADASVHVMQRDAAWITTIELGNATRTLELASCAEAQRTAALLIATALGPAREERERPARVRATPIVRSVALAPASEPAPAREPAPESEPARTSEPVATIAPVAEPARPEPRAAPQPVRSPTRDSSLRLRFGALFALGTLPGASGGPTLGLELTRGRLVGWLDARYLVARRAQDGDSSLRADIDLVAAALGASWMWDVGPLARGPLLELEAGLLRARGQGERAARDARAPWLAPAFGVRADAHLYRRASASMFASGSVPLWRPGVQLGDEVAFYTTSPLAFRLGIVLRVAIDSTKAQNGGQ